MDVSVVRRPLKQCKVTCVVNTPTGRPTVLLFITAEGSQSAVAAEMLSRADVPLQLLHFIRTRLITAAAVSGAGLQAGTLE